MYQTDAYKHAAKKAQRCLIPVNGFFEWHELTDKKKTKIPYYISSKEEPIASIAGLYDRYLDPQTNQNYYSYTLLTTDANPKMARIHNKMKRMPVIIPREYEKAWLNPNLSKDDVLALCKPVDDSSIKANSITKLISSKKEETNVAEVLFTHEYEKLDTDQIPSEL